jgi:serine/threonine protein kinase
MPTANELPGQVVSHYRLVRVLGAGGMGEVYEGFDETLKRRVAMKAIRSGKRLEAEAKARFLREARILSQLDHPNICRVYDYIEDGDRDWLILELIEGQTLRDAIVAGAALDPLLIATQIAAVLAATHAAGVVHRDMKPGNVMITPAGDVKVLDFGLSGPADVHETVPPARLGAAGPSAAPEVPPGRIGAPGSDLSSFQSQAGAVIGTLAYMSPEQGRGELATPASDMYSYGRVIEELFSGRLQYGPAEPSAEPRVEQQLPSAVAALVARLTDAAPSHRPTADAVVERLKWIAAAPRRRRRQLALAALVLLALGGAAKYTWDLSQARDEANRRREQAEDLIGFMVGDLRTRLTAVGRLEILDEVGKQALAYFQSVPADSLTGEELFRRSQTMHQLGQVRQARGDLAGAMTAYEESLTLAKAVARREPGNAEWQLGLGSSHFYVGEIKRRRGDLDGALENFGAYREIARALVARDPGNIEWKLELSYAHTNIATLLLGKGQLEAARGLLELTRDLKREVAAAKPADVAIQLSLATNHRQLGTVLQRLGDAEGAAASFERELALDRELRDKHPQNAQVLPRVPNARIFLGQARRALGHEDAALAEFQTAATESRALVKHDPANADWQRDLAVSELSVGRLLLDRGQIVDALARFRLARTILTPLLDRSRDHTQLQRNLAQVHFSMADALAALRQHERALRESDEALTIIDSLSNANPTDQTTAREHAMLLNLRGEILQAVGQPALARDAWTHSAKLLAPLASQTDYTMIDPYVRALVLLGRRAEAQVAFDRLTSLGYKNRRFLEFWKQSTAIDPSAGAPQ